jgi:hypothetical protein
MASISPPKIARTRPAGAGAGVRTDVTEAFAMLRG